MTTAGTQPDRTPSCAPASTLSTSPALALWQHLFSQEHGYLSVFSGIRATPDAKRLTATHTKAFPFPAAAAFAERWLQEQTADPRREVYVCGHLLTDRKRVKANSAPLTAAYVDGDGAQVPPHLPQPTATVRTSPGREQFYWRFTHPVAPEVGEEINRRLAYALGADKGGWDLTQLLRAPGFPNRKYAGEPCVELVTLTDTAYDPDDLLATLPPVPSSSPPSDQARGAASPPAHRPDEDEPPVVLSTEDLLVWQGQRRKHKPTGDLDRSASLYWIGAVLYDAGATRRTIVAALKERDATLGWHTYTDRGDDREYQRIVTKLERRERRRASHLGHCPNCHCQPPPTTTDQAPTPPPSTVPSDTPALLQEGTTPARPTATPSPPVGEGAGGEGGAPAAPRSDDPRDRRVAALEQACAVLQHEVATLRRENAQLREERTLLLATLRNPRVNAEKLTALATLFLPSSK